ncbi:hypothetical protein [Acetobacter persici]|uniref:Uncharacterized protein n=1 Tax=Acetobacter persici TaxID=1076596 RepID=A0A6V8I754_9PROT|nr:hypothetical protein [Acetobacter persici]MBS0961607.1 hypothetical protein [Acetobacter persici]MBS1015068.1 hypothetical protein [Acetobacter persici]OUI92315.1 hypothetical protein HK19_02320 [Acetobacter persici]GFE92887.1 hypothetical protein DmAi_09460 [Acetobacter persici]
MTETSPPEDKTWRVRIMDLSGGAEDNISEEVGGFHDLAHANAFARTYVRDSVERCRMPGSSAKDVLTAWMSFGEDALVIDAGESGWHSANELDDFAATRATPMERDWRALDPRRLVEDEDADEDLPGATDEPEEPSFH